MKRICFALAAIAMSVASQAAVKVEKVDYKGWKDCYAISNGTIRVVVVPAVGRIMSYGFVDGANVLWENDALAGLTFPPDPVTYRNYGGDQIGIAPSSLWGYPPDVFVDGQPWTTEVIDGGVRLTSPLGKKQKIQFSRQITLGLEGTELTMMNNLQNFGPNQEMGLAQHTAVNSPDVVSISTDITTNQPKGWFGFGKESLNPTFQTLRGQTISIRRSPTESRKIGSGSEKGILIATKGSLLFTVESAASHKYKYPDHGSAQVVSSSPDPYSYVELTNNSFLNRIEPREVMMQVVKWRLAKG